MKKRKNTNNISKNKWIGLLDEPQRTSVWVKCIIGAIVITFIASFGNSYSEIVATGVSNISSIEIIGKSFVKTLPEMVISVGTGILGAAFLNAVYRVYENNKLKNIKSLNYNEMLVDFFSSLEILNGKDRKNEEIRVEFHEFKKDDGTIIPELYKIKIKYEYETILQNNYIKCKFERIYNKKDSNGQVDGTPNNSNGSEGKKIWLNTRISEYTSGISLGLLEYDFYWGNDETGNFPSVGVENKSYNIYDAGINNHKSDLIKKINSWNTDQGCIIES